MSSNDSITNVEIAHMKKTIDDHIADDEKREENACNKLKNLSEQKIDRWLFLWVFGILGCLFSGACYFFWDINKTVYANVQSISNSCESKYKERSKTIEDRFGLIESSQLKYDIDNALQGQQIEQIKKGIDRIENEQRVVSSKISKLYDKFLMGNVARNGNN